MRAATLRTVATIAMTQDYSGSGQAVAFKAALDKESSRLVIFDDMVGVIELVKASGLITPPESFASTQESIAYWRTIISKVEVDWDHSELTIGSAIRLSYPTEGGESVVLRDWEHDARIQIIIERLWVLEPQPA